MELIIKPTVAEEIHDVCTWVYDPPYDIYNLKDDFGSVEEAITYFLDPEYSFHSIYEQNRDELLGIVSFGPDGKVAGGDYTVEALDIGMGIKPEWTGRGFGSEFVKAVIAFAEQTFHPPMLRVTIAAFNKRAQRVWQKAGFVEVSQFKATRGERPFFIYTLELN